MVKDFMISPFEILCEYIANVYILRCMLGLFTRIYLLFHLIYTYIHVNVHTNISKGIISILNFYNFLLNGFNLYKFTPIYSLCYTQNYSPPHSSLWDIFYFVCVCHNQIDDVTKATHAFNVPIILLDGVEDFYTHIQHDPT